MPGPSAATNPKPRFPIVLRRLDLPNVITVARIVACPVLVVLILSPDPARLALAFLVFVSAALSDLWDGYLARKHGWITDAGKLLDPVADKLLTVSTLVPFYVVSHRPGAVHEIPWWGPLPLWVLAVIFGREIVVTLFRGWALRRGSVLSAGPSGKIKAFIQNVFCGSLLLWYVLVRMAPERGWEETLGWIIWSWFHQAVTALALLVALVLTVYSMGVYYRENRQLLRHL